MRRLLRPGRSVALRGIGVFSLSSSSSRALSSCSARVVDMAARDGELRVFVVAGEVSGDFIASRLMASLKRISPFPVHFSGVGGTLMQNEGLRSLFPMEDISVMGIWELLPHLNTIRNRLNETTASALRFQPHVVVTVDAKGFSFRFLKQLRARCSQQEVSSPVCVHYVAPSFWAWKGGETRLRGLCNLIDHVLCILPFEEEVCKRNGLAATFIGHPILEYHSDYNLESDCLLDKVKLQGNGESFRQNYGLTCANEIVTLLPGSRLQEVTRMLPIFFNTMEILKKSFPDIAAVILVAPNHHVGAYIAKAVQKAPVPVALMDGASLDVKYDAFKASRAALCTSGTAVMELQLARLPCVVAYRAHFLTEWIIRIRSNIQFMSLPNIILDTAAIPEALFQACTPTNLATLVKQILCDVDLRENQIATAEKVLRFLIPRKESLRDLVVNMSDSCLSNPPPSVIAASIILYSAKKC